MAAVACASLVTSSGLESNAISVKLDDTRLCRRASGSGCAAESKTCRSVTWWRTVRCPRRRPTSALDTARYRDLGAPPHTRRHDRTMMSCVALYSRRALSVCAARAVRIGRREPRGTFFRCLKDARIFAASTASRVGAVDSAETASVAAYFARACNDCIALGPATPDSVLERRASVEVERKRCIRWRRYRCDLPALAGVR